MGIIDNEEKFECFVSINMFNGPFFGLNDNEYYKKLNADQVVNLRYAISEALGYIEAEINKCPLTGKMINKIVYGIFVAYIMSLEEAGIIE